MDTGSRLVLLVFDLLLVSRAVSILTRASKNGRTSCPLSTPLPVFRRTRLDYQVRFAARCFRSIYGVESRSSDGHRRQCFHAWAGFFFLFGGKSCGRLGLCSVPRQGSLCFLDLRAGTCLCGLSFATIFDGPKQLHAGANCPPVVVLARTHSLITTHIMVSPLIYPRRALVATLGAGRRIRFPGSISSIFGRGHGCLFLRRFLLRLSWARLARLPVVAACLNTSIGGTAYVGPAGGTNPELHPPPNRRHRRGDLR